MVIKKIYFYVELISLFMNLYDYDFEMVEILDFILLLVFDNLILNVMISFCQMLNGRYDFIIIYALFGSISIMLMGNACFLLSFYSII